MNDEIVLQLNLFSEHGEAVDETLDLALNLWYVYDASGKCDGVMAKAYVLVGPDWQKQEILSGLARSDWRTVPEFSLPDDYLSVMIIDGEPGPLLKFGKWVTDDIALFWLPLHWVKSNLPKGCPREIDNDTVFLVTPLYRHEDGRVAPLIERADGSRHP